MKEEIVKRVAGNLIKDFQRSQIEIIVAQLRILEEVEPE